MITLYSSDDPKTRGSLRLLAVLVAVLPNHQPSSHAVTIDIWFEIYNYFIRYAAHVELELHYGVLPSDPTEQKVHYVVARYLGQIINLPFCGGTAYCPYQSVFRAHLAPFAVVSDNDIWCVTFFYFFSFSRFLFFSPHYLSHIPIRG